MSIKEVESNLVDARARHAQVANAAENFCRFAAEHAIVLFTRTPGDYYSQQRYLRALTDSLVDIGLSIEDEGRRASDELLRLEQEQVRLTRAEQA